MQPLLHFAAIFSTAAICFPSCSIHYVLHNIMLLCSQLLSLNCIFNKLMTNIVYNMAYYSKKYIYIPNKDKVCVTY